MRRYKILIMAYFCFLSASCDVDRFPETNLSDQSFWKSENDLKAAANYLYTFLPTLPVTNDIWSNDAFGLASNAVSDGSRLVPSTADEDYNKPYRLIRAANNLIEKAPIALENGVGADRVNIYIAEASFFRAWAYFQLVQKYGDIPLILKTLDENAQELMAPVSPRAEVFNVIYQDLDLAGDILPLPSVLSAANYGRISNTASWALKARVALFEGTRSKFHSYGDAAGHLKIATEAAKKVIDSKEHDLFASYYNLFQLVGEGRQNKENIFVRQYGVNLNEAVTYHNTSRYETGAFPTNSLIDAYLMTDGLPIDKSPLYKKPTATLEVFTNRDNRIFETVMKRGDPFIGGQPLFAAPALPTGFVTRKYINITDWTNQRSFIDLPIIRYAEILLIYAEAKFEAEGQISDADLDISVNLLRKRGKVNPLTNAFAFSNGLQMREEIRRERRVELALEGHRYWDLIRWKTAETELPKDVVGSYYFKSEFGSQVVPLLTADNHILVQSSGFRSFNPQRDYLWPFPINELALNPALKQNPGW